MRILIILILLLLSGYTGSACKCKPRSLETDISLSKEIFIGRIINSDWTRTKFRVLVMKSWKGNIKTDTLEILNQPDDCHQFIFPNQKDYLFFLDDIGIHRCSRSRLYHTTKDVAELDAMFSKSIWINEKMRATLDDVEYNRKYVVSGVDIKDKKCVFVEEKYYYFLIFRITRFEIVKLDDIDQLDGWRVTRIFQVAENVSTGNCHYDYVFFAFTSHQAWRISNVTKERVLRKVRKACK